MKKTPLYDLHVELGAKMVAFSGYEMPVQYKNGIIHEHLHTRQIASLFDVSHMGQIEISGPRAQHILEQLLPLDLDTITISEMAYSVLLNPQGGVIDDLIITRRNRDNFVLVVNAGCKDKVAAYLSKHIEQSRIHVLHEQALLAVQGPQAVNVLQDIFHDDIANLNFMQGMLVKADQMECFLSRSGYTGEDGFEISLASRHANKFTKKILASGVVEMAGLGARDSLRLEAGLCLYGHELNEEISPIEADIKWCVSKARRDGGKKAGNFVGSDVILHQLAKGTTQKRIGLTVQGKVPVREGAILWDEHDNEVGYVSSGTFSPSLNVPIAMGYVDERAAIPGAMFKTRVRENDVFLNLTRLPFVAHHYVKHAAR